MSASPEDPLDFVDLEDILEFGPPETWISLGPKPGSPVPADSSVAIPGTMKHYDMYRDELGQVFAVHYFRHPDGTVGNVKIEFPVEL